MRLIRLIAGAALLVLTGIGCWVTCTPVAPTPQHPPSSNVHDEVQAHSVTTVPGLHPSDKADRAVPSSGAVLQPIQTGNPSEPLPPPKSTVEVRSALLSPVARGTSTPESVAITQAKSTDPRSLAMLSSLERDLHRAPPPEVHALVRAHAEGANRERLLALLEQTLAHELSIKLTVRRWIDEVTPDPNQPPAPRKPLLSKGAGTGWVAPLTTR